LAQILEGLNVIEMGAGSVAASIAGMVLADAGARVIKLEAPEGDRLRRDNPSGFRIWNRGKESLLCDLRTDPGQATLRRMAKDADVVIEAFSPGLTRHWGIDAQTLRADNPALVHCAITGFGAEGPYAGVKAYDAVVAAKMGLWSRGAFSYRDGPMLKPMPWPSFGAAMQATAGIMGALLVREKTGRGQSLSATLAAGTEPIDYFGLTLAQLAARAEKEPSGKPPVAQPFSRYGVLVATSDGRLIQTSTMQQHQGKALCEVAELGDLVDEPRFAKLPQFDTVDDAQAFEDLLLEAFIQKPLSHWLPRLLASPDVAFEVSATSEEGLDHPQIVHNGDAITIDDPEVGPIRQVGPLGHFERTPMKPNRPAPALGANHGPLIPHPLPKGGQLAPAHPFAGVTVLDFGYFYAMPYGTAMLGSLGARIIKIEDGSGDPHRKSFGPEVGTSKTTLGKESLSLNLRSEEGRRIAQALAAKADVFVTGFRSGVPERLGLGYEALKAINPRLLYVNAAGYGSSGPYAARALYAQAASAVGGSFGRQVGYWSKPERVQGWSVMELQAIVFPRLHQVIDGDSNAALGLLAALSLGIYHQQRTGEGQLLDASMIAFNAWAYSDDFCAYAGKPPTPLCDEEEYGLSALERLYPAADGTWLCLTVPSQREFSALADAVGAPGLATDLRFVDAEARRQNDAALIEALTAIFAAAPALAWEAKLSAADVGAAAVSMGGLAATIAFDEGLRASGLTVVGRHPLYGDLVRWGPSVGFSETPGSVRPVCLRGEHNRALLTELGYDAVQIAKLEADGVVTAPA
jgi:crotonobetainyl-CoA:carnitine CoA-transferase CaiB-like acyl-CoA transferase